MKRVLMSAATLAVLGFLMAPASAASITVLPSGNLNNGPGVETFDTATVGANAGYVSATLGATLTGGSFENGSIDSVSAAPYMGNPGRDTTTYYAVGGGTPGPGSPGLMVFGSMMSSLSFYLGSMDDYNIFNFYKDALLVASINGNDLAAAMVGLVDNGGQDSFASNHGFLVSIDGGFNSLQLSSGQNALELDNIGGGILGNAGTTPLPGTLPLMASALGAAGLMWGRRKKKAASQLA